MDKSDRKCGCKMQKAEKKCENGRSGIDLSGFCVKMEKSRKDGKGREKRSGGAADAPARRIAWHREEKTEM